MSAALVGGICLVIYVMIIHGVGILDDEARLDAAITSASMDPVGFLFASLPAQLSFLGVAYAAALRSRDAWTELLSYRRSIMQWWSWPLLAIATPFVTSLGVWGQRLAFGHESEQLEALGEVAKGTGDGFVLAPILVLGLLAPLAEETLFRGYMQQRLLKRWSPWWAITVSSAFFLIAHWEPAHILAILPLSLWLGVIAWRSQSVWPAVLCHAAQNLLFVSANQEPWASPIRSALGMLFPISMVAFGIAVVALWRRPLSRR